MGRTHLKTHPGEKAYKRNQCDFVSVQAGNLRTHLKSHLRKAYKCNKCDFASVRADNLRRQLKSTRMQPMRLCICTGRQFEDTFENSLWREAYKCNQCNFASIQAGDLRKHLKTP